MWARLDDRFLGHPKILAAGPGAELLQVRAILYASRHLTNGHVPDAAVPVLVVGLERLDVVTDWPTHMVKQGLWERARGGGYMIHDFADYNPGRDEVLRVREARARAGGLGGVRSGVARRNKSEAQSEASALPDASHSHEAKANPVLVLVPEEKPETTTGSAGGAEVSPSLFENGVSTGGGTATIGQGPAPSGTRAALLEAAPSILAGSSLAVPGPTNGTAPPAPPRPPTPAPWPSAEALVELWNERAPAECPRVKALSEARCKKAVRALRQFPERAMWESALTELRRSRFLRGLAPSNGHPNWKATFDWLLGSGKDGVENLLKLLEGNYARKREEA
jgi:hypothetical protein